MAPSNVENFSPHIIKQISREIAELTRNPLEGIRIVFDEDDVTSVQADIDGPPGTPYHGGSFRIRLVLGKHFPTTPPKGFFVTKIFHPNVGKNGEICVNTLKKDWNQDLGIKHILLTIKCLLIVPNPESALNEEAGKMLLEQYDDYCKRAKMMTEVHAPKAKIVENVCQDEQEQQQSSAASSTSSVNTANNLSNNNNNPTTLCDKTASPSCSTKSATKHPHDVCCSDEPVTKRLNNILDCYNTSPTASDQMTHSLPQQPKASSQQSNSSQSSKVSQGSTSAINNARNRGLKRVLRSRS